MHLGQTGAATTVTVQGHGRTVQAALPSEEGIYARSLAGASLVGTVGSNVAVISADYTSNPSGGSYQCGAGTETVVRVIALAPRPHQTFGQLVASCWYSIDASEVTWNPVAHTLTIERTTYAPPPAGGAMTAQDLRTTYAVATDGTVASLRVERLP